MPKLREETFGSGDQSWLGSTVALRHSRTGTIDISAFTDSVHYPDGYIPSGTRLAIVNDLFVPYDATEGTTTGAGILAGFLLTDQKVVGSADFAAAIFDGPGRIIVDNLPGSFTPPAAAAKKLTTVTYA
ncbi:MAG: potassium transporter [Microbacterium sp.]|nr:MAG: potassium transporter [Microbacterium sp.]